MILLKDFYGKEVRLTDKRLSHILRHSEMIGQEKFIAETLSRPDSIILSHHDSKVCLYHKLFLKKLEQKTGGYQSLPENILLLQLSILRMMPLLSLPSLQARKRKEQLYGLDNQHLVR